MEQTNNEIIEINVKELFFILVHRLWMILIIGLLGAVCAGVISKISYVPIYASTAKVYVINRQNEDRTTYTDLQTGLHLAKDFMILVKSRPVTEQVIEELDLKMTHEQLAGLITITTLPDTRIIDIRVAHPIPETAKQLVDSVAKVSSERLVTVMGIDKVNIVEDGNIPSSPFNSNIKRNIILGGLLGIIISSFIIILIYTLNESIQSAEDIEKYLGITTLGTIPIVEGATKNKRKSKQRKRKAALAN